MLLERGLEDISFTVLDPAAAERLAEFSDEERGIKANDPARSAATSATSGSSTLFLTKNAVRPPA